MKFLAGLLLAVVCAVPAQAGLKIYISADMEGVAGTVTGDQLLPAGFEYGRFREFMTREVLAAVQAAKEAGATEIVVSDSHGNEENLLVELFPKDVRIIRSSPRRLGMMAGIDKTFDAVIFIGYHASTNNLQGVRAHTFSSASLTRVALNGVEMTEGAFNAAIAGHFGVPVVMMAGDDAAIAEVRALVGNIEAAETKKTLGFHSTNTLTPQASQELIFQRAKAALARLKSFKPYTVAEPVSLEISFKNYRPVEVLAYLPIVERTSSHSIRYRAKDILEACDFVGFVTSYNIELAP